MPSKLRACALVLAAVAIWLIGGPAPAAGQGTGLTGQYYNDPGTGAHFVTLVLTRTDPTVNFDWGTGSPGPGVQIDNFSVRWTGQVLTPVTGNYTFQTISDDGVRLWMNGQLVIDNWTDHGPTTNTSPALSLVAGTKYDVKMEFYEHGGGAFARLSWAYPGRTTQVIPQAQLYPPGAASNQAPTANAGADQTITLPNAATLTGTATDDGQPNPPGALTNTWSKVSGPGTVTFSNPNALSTTATFSTDGLYVVRLTASDGALTGSDDAAITANPAPTGSGVTGSGTPGTIPKWTGSTTQGNSVIVESSGLIGIGTSTPTVKLDVNGRLKAKSSIDTGASYKIGGTQALGVDAVLRNTAIGVNALLSNSTGHDNTAIGADALVSNTIGRGNTATGVWALRNHTIGSGTDGWSDNTATGVEALRDNTTGHSNTATGVGALRNNTTGFDNTAMGADALEGNTIGNYNTAVGADALRFNTTGVNNTAVGDMALLNNTTGGANTATGVGALGNNTIGTNNTAFGNDALQNNTSGSSNTALGDAAGSMVTGNSNIDIGHQGVAGESATIRIGSSSQTRTFIAGISGVVVSGGVGVLVNSSGQLGTSLSSRRVKDEIRDMGEASQGLLRLRPVTFRYKQTMADGSRPLQYGLIAEEVAEVYPELVASDPKTGEPQTVLYHVLPALLLNELQRQQRQLETQATQIEARAAELAALRARLAILEARHPATSTAHRLNGAQAGVPGPR